MLPQFEWKECRLALATSATRKWSPLITHGPDFQPRQSIERTFERVPDGSVSELYVGGDALAAQFSQLPRCDAQVRRQLLTSDEVRINDGLRILRWGGH